MTVLNLEHECTWHWADRRGWTELRCSGKVNASIANEYQIAVWKYSMTG